MSGITEHDMDAVMEAVRVLEGAGFTIEGLDDVERTDHGIQFSPLIVVNTRTKPLEDDSE